jgi:hypothetical protein
MFPTTIERNEHTMFGEYVFSSHSIMVAFNIVLCLMLIEHYICLKHSIMYVIN